jgi:predicted DNA binding CopG/RHH family protein
MKKISKKRESELDAIIEESGDEKDWDEKKLGNHRKFSTPASEFSKNIGTSIRMPLKLIQELKKIAEEEGMPYQTLVKSVLTKYVRNHKAA